MANHLKMALVHSILTLSAQGWSRRRVARELGVDRETVSRHIRLAARLSSPQAAAGAKPANAPISETGSGSIDCDSNPANAPILTTGSGRDGVDSQPANAPISATGSLPDNAGRRSDCEPWRELIQAKREQGLSARRIHQDLIQEHQAAVGYDSVRRFLRRLGWARPLPFRRMECGPGEEAQVDFGTGAPIVLPDGKRRQTHVFRIVLSHSRKGYSEATFRQTTEDFIGCLENSFAHFGGVPQRLVIDNLRAAVKQPDWFDPELVPKLQAFCAHYGVVILPTKPYTPRHKGKIERGIGYVKGNALKGRTFDSLEEQNRHLADWERTVADTRIHGTTKRHVGKVFDEIERAALRSLPRERFPFFHEGRRIVSRDGHIEVARAYYSVPPEYLTRTVWVRWDARLVRIFNTRLEPIAVHVRHEQGRFSTHGAHIAREKISGIERGTASLLSTAALVGAQTRQWSEAMITARGIEGTRVLLGLLSLTKKHPSTSLEKACEIALSHGAFRLRTIRQLLKRPALKQEPLPFLEEHPIIRPLEDYGRIVAAALERKGPPAAEGFERHGSGVPCTFQTQDPARVNGQGLASAGTRPRSGYPSPSCTSAELGSVLPDRSILRSASLPQQEHQSHE